MPRCRRTAGLRPSPPGYTRDVSSKYLQPDARLHPESAASSGFQGTNGLLHVGELDVVIEVRTKLFEHRVQDKQRRADLILDRLSSLPLGQVGVWLILSEGAWSQT